MTIYLFKVASMPTAEPGMVLEPTTLEIKSWTTQPTEPPRYPQMVTL